MGSVALWVTTMLVGVAVQTGKLGIAEEVGAEHVLARRGVLVRAVGPALDRAEVHDVLVLVVAVDLAHVVLAVGEDLLPPAVLLPLVPRPVAVVPADAVVTGAAGGHGADAPVEDDEVARGSRRRCRTARKGRPRPARRASRRRSPGCRTACTAGRTWSRRCRSSRCCCSRSSRRFCSCPGSCRGRWGRPGRNPAPRGR